MRQLIAFFASAAVTAALAMALWWASLGFYETAEHWVVDVLVAKERHAASIDRPKIMIVAGSNAMFGMDSKTLERLSGMPVANLASHANLHIDFHLELVLRHARRGDLVIMPLEFSYYNNSLGLTDWHIANMSSWGHRYIKAKWSRLVEYFRHASVVRTARRLRMRPIPFDPEEVVLATVAANTEIQPWRGYSYRLMTRWGDFLVEGGRRFDGNSGYTTGSIEPVIVERLVRLQAQLQERGARLVLTWPVTIRNPDFDLSIETYKNRVEMHRHTLEAAGLTVICEARDFQFEREMSLDTPDHVGARGGVIRTEALAACLQGRKPDRALGERLYAERKGLVPESSP